MRASTLPPGPGLPAFLQAVFFGLRYPEYMEHAHRRYGATFSARIGGLPPSVVTVDRETIREIFTGDPLTKRHSNDQLRPLFGARSLVVLEPAEHMARRRLLLPAFHGDRIASHAELIDRLIGEHLDRWSPGTEVRVHQFAQRFTLDVILQAVLGVSDRATALRLRRVFDAMVRLPGSGFAGYFPKLGVRSRANVVAGRYWRLRDELDETLLEHVVATRSSPGLTQRNDILAMLVQARDETGARLADTDLCDELKTLIAAGHETTASAIAWGVELLTRDRVVIGRARTAIEAGENDYLDALVKEILRLRPPVPMATRRLSVPLRIGPFTIEPGVPIIVNIYGVHHDGRLYPDPHRLSPERFLGGGPEPYAFVPFGGGAHRCLGAALATLEIKSALSAIIDRFELTPPGDKPALPRRHGITLVPRGGGRVRIAALRDGARRAA
jgi:cytochrome P450